MIRGEKNVLFLVVIMMSLEGPRDRHFKKSGFLGNSDFSSLDYEKPKNQRIC